MNQKKPKILTAKGSFPTARNIRDAIEILTGKHYFISDEASKVNDILFRYGNSDPVSGNDPNLNSIEFINLAKDKYSWSIYAQAHDIYSPIYSNNSVIPTEFPVLIRTTLTGFGGRGIIVCNSLEEYNQHMRSTYWWTKFVKCSFEVRIHLFGNKVHKIYKKVKEGEDNSPIRNKENGYHFSLKDEGNENYPKLITICENMGNLFQEIGGYFSAIDAGWDAKSKRYFIFETNSAPGLNSVNVTEYAEYIINKLGLERKESV